MSWTVHEDEYKSVEPDLEQILQNVGKQDDDANVTPSGKYTKSSQVFTTPTSLTPAALNLAGCEPAKNSWTYSQPTTSPSVARPFQPRQGLSQNGVSPHYTQNANPHYDRHNKMNDGYSISPMGPKRRAHGLEHLIPNEHPKRQMAQDDINPADMAPIGFNDWNNVSASKFQSTGSIALPTNNITAEALQGKVYDTAKDQHGCRFLQRWLDTNCNPEAVQVIMNEIIPHVAELMTDQYANFLLQKLFDIMPNDVRHNVARVAAPKISSIAMTPHGTFSVQKMIETISTREEMEMVREALSEDAVRLVKDAHGNHVIQKVLQRFRYADKQFIYDAVARDCVSIAKNKQGCCVLQRCLEYASPIQKTTLISHILSCCLDIVQDPFGNYVLQYVLEEKDSKINDTIAIAFLPHLVHLCMNKFSSNVMEKVLRGASVQVQEMYVEMMCNPDIVSRLIQDDFGNYVLQTALVISNPAQAENLVAAIRPLLPLIKSAPYAKKLESKMDAIIKRTENCFRTHGDFEARNTIVACTDTTIDTCTTHIPPLHGFHHDEVLGPETAAPSSPIYSENVISLEFDIPPLPGWLSSRFTARIWCVELVKKRYNACAFRHWEAMTPKIEKEKLNTFFQHFYFKILVIYLGFDLHFFRAYNGRYPTPNSLLTNLKVLQENDLFLIKYLEDETFLDFDPDVLEDLPLFGFPRLEITAALSLTNIYQFFYLVLQDILLVAAMENELINLAHQLGSEDFLVAKEARQKIRALLSPEHVAKIFSLKEKNCLSELLNTVTAAGDIEVHTVISSSLTDALNSPACGKILEADQDGLLANFFCRTLTCPDLSVAMTARKPLIALVGAAGPRACSTSVARVIESQLTDDSVLRLVDCDNIDSADNKVVYDFMSKETLLVERITQKTLNAFDNDILLLANYLLVCGVLARFDSHILAGKLQERIQVALEHPEDELPWTSAAECCACALWACDTVADLFSKDWIKASIAVVSCREVSEDITAFGLRVLGSACTTKAGWDTTASLLASSLLQPLLQTKSVPKTVSTLNFLSIFYGSLHFQTGRLNLDDCVMEAWKLRSSLEETVRIALWSALEAMATRHPFPLQNACAAFLSATQPGEISAVREKQVRVAEMLLLDESMTHGLQVGLKSFVRGGLHPPGSSGVDPSLLSGRSHDDNYWVFFILCGRRYLKGGQK
eukprot:gene10107-7074_t